MLPTATTILPRFPLVEMITKGKPHQTKKANQIAFTSKSVPTPGNLAIRAAPLLPYQALFVKTILLATSTAVVLLHNKVLWWLIRPWRLFLAVPLMVCILNEDHAFAWLTLSLSLSILAAAKFMLVYTGGQNGRDSVIVMCCDNTTTSGGAIKGDVVQLPDSGTYYVPFFTSLVCGFLYNFTIVTENVRVDTIWNATGGPYYLANDIQVYPGVTLTIDSAVVEGGKFSIKVGGEIVISSSTVDLQFYWSKQTVTVERSTFSSCSLEGNILEATDSSFLSCDLQVNTTEATSSSFFSCGFKGNTLEAINSSFQSCDFEGNTLEAASSSFLSCGLEVNALVTILSSFHSCGFDGNTLEATNSSFLSCGFEGNTLEATNTSFLSSVFETETHRIDEREMKTNSGWVKSSCRVQTEY
jgi:hypothetical protein